MMLLDKHRHPKYVPHLQSNNSREEKSGELCKWAIPPAAMIHSFVLNTFLTPDIVFALALNFSGYKI